MQYNPRRFSFMTESINKYVKLAVSGSKPKNFQISEQHFITLPSDDYRKSEEIQNPEQNGRTIRDLSEL